VLLALLHLNVKNIRIGPRLPAFLTPAVLKVLVDTFGLKPVGEVETDLKAMANAA
jgi:hydroxylamine reductase